MKVKAVFFDLGGVLFSSPLPILTELETQWGLCQFSLRKVLSSSVSPLTVDLAWHQLETGTISPRQFHQRLIDDCLRLGVGPIDKIDGNKLLYELGTELKLRKEMAVVIMRLSCQSVRVVAITNNWDTTTFHSQMNTIDRLFDHLIESYKVRLRKPDPRIYQLAIDLVSRPEENVVAANCVFLDDLGANLKSARQLGIHTIRVSSSPTEWKESIDQLQKILLSSEIAITPNHLPEPSIDCSAIIGYINFWRALGSSSSVLEKKFLEPFHRAVFYWDVLCSPHPLLGPELIMSHLKKMRDGLQRATSSPALEDSLTANLILSPSLKNAELKEISSFPGGLLLTWHIPPLFSNGIQFHRCDEVLIDVLTDTILSVEIHISRREEATQTDNFPLSKL